jgi:hypothetical protein
VFVDQDAEYHVDAESGEVRGPFDNRGFWSGSIRQGTILPGAAGAFTSVRFRGVRLRKSATDIGWSHPSTGTYDLPNAPPWTVDLVGGRSTTGGPWLEGRVERRNAAHDTPILSSVGWDPSASPNRDFSSPDAWPSNPTTLHHGQQIVYGWLTYWVDLMSDWGQVPGTISYYIPPTTNPTPPGANGIALDGGFAGSGQSTRGVINVSWPSNDGNPANSDVWMGVFAHEFGHLVGDCNARAGSLCLNENPGLFNESRPPEPSWQAWRRQVWGSHRENFTSFLSAFATQWVTPVTGGSGPFTPDFRYGGYWDTTDDFAVILPDSEGGRNCRKCASDPASCCSATHVCLTDTDESPLKKQGEGGLCARRCSTTFPVLPCPGNAIENGLFCNMALAGGVCWHNDYTNAWFTTVGPRLVFEANWDMALFVLLSASAGTAKNGLRDFNLGTDSWYQTMAGYNLETFEVTRAVRSVTNEAGVTSVDDFTDSAFRALPVVVRTAGGLGNGTRIWWGNGASEYPNLRSATEADWVSFRGRAGVAYEVEAIPRTSTLGVQVSVWRLNTNGTATLIATVNGGINQTVVLPTGPLPADAWYAVRFASTTTATGNYEARIRLASQAQDDFASTNAEAHPLVHARAVPGYLTSGDVDRFQLYVPATTSVTATASGTPTPTVRIRNASGTQLAAGVGTATVASVAAGYYYVDVVDVSSSARAYTVSASLGCASSSCDDLSAASPLAVRYSWGDQFAGRLPTTASTATYAITVNAGENVSASLADNGNTTCRLGLDLIPPAALGYFQSGPVWRWVDLNSDNGPAASSPDAPRRGAGGHFIAPATGQYLLRVRSRTPAAPDTCTYALIVERNGKTETLRPVW